MQQHEHFSHGLLYSLSPKQIAQLHIGKIVNSPSEVGELHVRKSFIDYLVILFKKPFKMSIKGESATD